jgi:hypothetical protein
MACIVRLHGLHPMQCKAAQYLRPTRVWRSNNINSGLASCHPAPTWNNEGYHSEAAGGSCNQQEC